MTLTARNLPAGGVRVRLHRPVRPLPPQPRQRPDGQLGPGRGRGARHAGGRGRVGGPHQPRHHPRRGQPRQVPLGQGEAGHQLVCCDLAPPPQVPHYMAAQYLGSLTASVTVFLAYWDSLVWYEHDRGEYRWGQEVNSNDQKALYCVLYYLHSVDKCHVSTPRPGLCRTPRASSRPSPGRTSPGRAACWTSSSPPPCSCSACAPSPTAGSTCSVM